MIAPSLTNASNLFEGISPERVTAENAYELRNATLGGYEAFPPFRMTRGDGETRPVKTINELRAAEDDGFYAATNADMRIWSYFKRVDDLLAAMFIARPSRVSFLQPITRIDLLPARLVPLELNVENPDDRTNLPAPNVTIADMSRDGRCKVDITTSSRVFVQAAVETTLTEVMRGDLNGDGIEDVLVWQFHRMAGGTMHWSSSLALTRTAEQALFSKVDLPFR